MPLKGMSRQKYLEIKFNGKENANLAYNKIYGIGKKNNIFFQFDKISITPNSLASHKLLALAHKKNKQNDVIESIFFSYFIEGKNIGNKEVLIKIAKDHNIYTPSTAEYLYSNEDKENLINEAKEARTLGINGIPCFIVNKKYVLFGVQDEENFLKIFNNVIKNY